MKNIEIDWEKVDLIIENTLEEDLGSGDVTTDAIFSVDDTCEALIIAKEEGIIAGIPIAERVFQKLDPEVTVAQKLKDGEHVNPGDEILVIKGSIHAVLSGERLSLNLLQRMSGIATATSKYVAAISGYRTRILDTRKTAPGLRVLDKYAVSIGGGCNHRFGLYDAVLIKDNHIDFAGNISNAVEIVRSKYQSKFKVEVETSTLDEVREALKAGADIIMLDNMTVEMMKEAVRIINGKSITEASGGITLDTIGQVADTGVDFISVGAITHSSPALDIGLYMV
ncbi:MAG: carboxylating nicotinate-nucleotide diphosphorylase [Candidatus Dadabacteria bacterium]|nr:carboxylating nicotinate-nucleotide diphosphorylase [Candidatus Dadabacteria bacterium]MCZ6865530.1 carboxylating nicotinate-nucleotide diphosphorylase [Candidatus Dadabacteria bacterium]